MDLPALQIKILKLLAISEVDNIFLCRLRIYEQPFLPKFLLFCHPNYRDE